MVDVARYFIHFLVDESCGKCAPCREGLHALDRTLTRICAGEGKEDDLKLLEDLASTVNAASLCQLGGTAGNPVLSTLRWFREEYEEHIRHKKCRAHVCKPLLRFDIVDACTGCTLCAKNCPTKAIAGERKALHRIDQAKCIQCGVCADVCKFDAVTVRTGG